MPRRATHDLLTIVTAPAAYWLGGLLLPEAAITAGIVTAATHIVSGIWFSPDLDINASRWGPLGILWAPYTWLVPHRSWLSHSLLIGPLLRLVYLALLLAGLAYGLLWLLGEATQWSGWLMLVVNTLHPYAVYGGAALTGFLTGNAAHTIPDTVTTAVKRRV